jgi:prefoldin alpha subunit
MDMEIGKEKIFQLQLMEQEINQLDQQVQLIDQHLSEMQRLKESLEELDKTNEKKIMASLGKGIYIPAEITDKKLIVEVGNKNLVKKTIPETIHIVEDQIGRLSEAKIQISQRMGDLQNEIMQVVNEAQKEVGA